MNHVSEQELCDYIDGRAAAPDDKASRHIAECASCRARVELQRQIRNSASHADRRLLSKNFTHQVMRKVLPPRPAPRFSWLVENSANIFAMLFVVGIIASIIYIVAQSTPDAGDSVYVRQFSLWRDAHASVVNTLSSHHTDTFDPVLIESHCLFINAFVMGLGALLLLGSLDKLRSFSRTFRAR